MDVRDMVMGILKGADLKVPIGYQVLKKEDSEKNPQQYVTFFEVSDVPVAFDDNEERYAEHMMQIDIWSTTNFDRLRKGIRKAMKRAGWTRFDQQDLFESDTKIYHLALTYTKTLEAEDDG